jgi:hypothetical protein
MSVNVEWMTASSVTPDLVAYGTEMPDGQKVTEAGALVFSENEVFVIEGSLPQLRAFAAKVLRTVNGHTALDRAVMRAKAAAEEDSNDAEIERLQEALDEALLLLGREDLR